MLALPPRAEEKWKKYLHRDDLNWECIYQNPYKITYETAVQSLQYKIVHRFYPCNYTLSIWYDNLDPLCSTCDEVDFLEHFFYYCPPVYNYWQELQEWFYKNVQIKIPLTKVEILFGLNNDSEDNFINILNYCILYSKWFRHYAKGHNEEPVLTSFLIVLKRKMDTLKMKHELEGRQEVFNKKWLVLYNLL